MSLYGKSDFPIVFLLLVRNILLFYGVNPGRYILFPLGDLQLIVDQLSGKNSVVLFSLAVNYGNFRM